MHPDPEFDAAPVAGPGTLEAVALRVAELERQVANLQGRLEAQAATQVPGPMEAQVQTRVQPRTSAPPPLIVAGEPAAMAPPPIPSSGAPPRPAAMPQPRSLEDRLGGQVLNRVGVVAVLVGVSLALKLAFDNGYIGPIGRVLIGLASGAALVVWSERFRRKYFAVFSYSLKAVGTGVLYLTLWAGFHLYHLLPAPAALGAMILVTAWNAYMAWAQDAELLGAYALTGAFATPALLSTGGNHEIFLFTYIAAIDLATLLLVRAKPWPRLLLAALLGTISFFIGWFVQFFSAVQRSPGDRSIIVTLAYLAVFLVIFAAASVRGFVRYDEEEQANATPGQMPGRRGFSRGGFRRSPAIVSVLIPLGTALFVSLATYSVLEDSGFHDALAWVALGLAAVYLALMRVQRSATSAAVHLAVAVVLLTSAITLKASGHTLTIAWLLEGLALLWISTRFASRENGLLLAAGVLRTLSAAAFGLGLVAVMFEHLVVGEPPGFFNANLAADVVALVTLGAAAWLLSREQDEPALDELALAGHGENRSVRRVALALLAFAAAALHPAIAELQGNYTSGHPPFQSAAFWSAMVSLAALAAAAWFVQAYALQRREDGQDGQTPVLLLFARGTSVCFHLVALAVGVRELSVVFFSADAGLERSLAISGFLMVYGALLLAFGFVRRLAFARWEALVLLLFTIAKVFLFDVSGLSAGYRVASFLGLGAILMGVSFAYQKDWLGLRGADDASEELMR